MSIIQNLWKNRLIVFFLFAGTFLIFNYVSTGTLLPTAETKDMWFHSGLFMVLFSTLFIEPYYSSPKNVITNIVPILLVMFAIYQEFPNKTQWGIIVISLIVLLIIAIVAMSLADNNESPSSIKNRIAERLKNLTVLMGRGKVLYSGVFLYFLFTYYAHDSPLSGYVLGLLIIWAVMLTINQNDLHNVLWGSKKEKDKNAVGRIFGVESQKMFLAKLFDNSIGINKFDVVKFNYSINSRNTTFVGIIFDYYLLNQERWVKVLQLDKCKTYMKHCLDNTVYAVVGDESRELQKELNANNFVGVVIENSKIGKIKFEYSKSEDNIQEGDLLQLSIGNKTLFYQVVSGTTSKEQLEARNEAGFIVGEALQLGEWNNSNLSFNKFGWVPQINTPIFSADTDKIKTPSYNYPEFQIGNIPNTNLPSVINLDQAISHHMALLGVTGSGKSFLARRIIEEIKVDTKVICVDFNKEFVSEMSPAPSNIISDEKAKEISENIDWINNELEKFGNQQNKAQIEYKRREIKKALRLEITNFLNNSNDNVKVFELPDVCNTTGILDYTKYFFKVLFEVAKERQTAGNPVKLCVVLEEAHTIIPEWNFAGSSDKTSQSLVNSIGQIALQGRKYGVGFLVIAQRTANVSKTVLTQCNTVVCFQAFDETSFNFLSNYVGKDMVEALPSLRQYHAVVTGKAVKSNIPMIVDLCNKHGNISKIAQAGENLDIYSGAAERT